MKMVSENCNHSKTLFDKKSSVHTVWGPGPWHTAANTTTDIASFIMNGPRGLFSENILIFTL